MYNVALKPNKLFYSRFQHFTKMCTQQQIPISLTLKLNIDVKLKKKCNGEITKEELTDAINKLKLNKRTGSDGLSVEFY